MLQKILILTLLASGASSLAFAQSKADRNDERRENERVHEAKQELQKAQRELGVAIKANRMQRIEVQRAEGLLRSTQLAYSQAREAAEERLADSSGLPEAIRTMRTLRNEIALLSDKIVEQLHKSPKWKVVSKKATDSAQIREELLADETRTDDELAAKLTELDKLIAAPGAMELEATDGDPKVTQLKRDYHESLDAIAQLRRKIDSSKIDADPEVQSARSVVEASERELNRQRKSLATLLTKVTGAQSSLVSANRKLQQAQAADQKDSNKPKKNR